VDQEALSKILTFGIFIVMFGFLIWDKVHRFIPAVIAGLITLSVLLVLVGPDAVTSVLNVSQLFTVQFWIPGQEEPVHQAGINWQTIIFIGGMMLMVEGMAEAGFFRWMCLEVARLARYRVVPLLILMMLLSAFLSMFIDSITVLLFLAATTIELARHMKFDPIPIIVAEIFAANLGGAATMSGDPPNIIIGTSLGYTFMDFLLNTGVIVWLVVPVMLVYFYFALRRQLLASHVGTEDQSPDPRSAITNMRHFIVVSAIFLFVILLLITHAMTGLSVALIGVIAAALAVAAGGREAGGIVRRLDWRTLLFFMGLFVVVAGMEVTGVLGVVADQIGAIAGGDLAVALLIILWLSAFTSAIVDNIPFAATMVPVIKSLAATYGFPLEPLAWSLALGTDVGGNGTPIGASANVVGLAVADREGYPCSWGRYMKIAVLPTIIAVALFSVYLLVRYV
jgi:Na+/H+ antiporter NhaD/arsenite permease-like protein